MKANEYIIHECALRDCTRKIETFIQYLKDFHFVKPKDTNIQKFGFKNR